MGKFRLKVLVDPLFGHPSWEDYGIFADERSLAEAVKAVAENFRDAQSDLDKYAAIETVPARSHRAIRPAAVLRRHFPEWSERFFACMKQCRQCALYDEMEPAGEDGSDYLCRKGRPWFGTMPCPYYLPAESLRPGDVAAAREIMTLEGR